ncbi:MAG: hypothetical protein A2660_02190 [Candidatus Doudnabacteria bacterium RIFCSPHIGHO2_01_FULL_45_18]|uniref:Uncharacterized protein n=1 Tax=Candidatus Doudnabacteria bacterium RIFCSPHIGHO2_01_FULL_45_18 TaxID=1817823 RepID=A0A1F5NRX7_9BACT|nr:MAG: hypothetical protein A2660_02190 [Candidatus Doudnabacteria bacterium RIFCSPHIGHO2_01_FULL_45_18]
MSTSVDERLAQWKKQRARLKQKLQRTEDLLAQTRSGWPRATLEQAVGRFVAQIAQYDAAIAAVTQKVTDQPIGPEAPSAQPGLVGQVV